jgi:stress-induced morphogen
MGVVVVFFSGLVRPSRSRRVQSLIEDVFSGRGE